MRNKSTVFSGLITFDADTGHAKIKETLEKWNFKATSLNGRELPNNTYIGTFEKDVELNSSGSFPSNKLKTISDQLADNYREKIKKLFEDEGISGKIYVLFSWKEATDDSVGSNKL